MSRVTLVVNGDTVTAEVEPRTHLADFLRDDCLLSGTHLGCEHGVCGACTLLIDGAPARSCIAFTAACDGAEICTIEGLEEDPTIIRLRAAFAAEHAVQCGYCTPGVLVTARDIVQRLPDADDARIRLELAGNLCRCTGYAGIVRAIKRVLAEDVSEGRRAPAPLPPLPPMPMPGPEAAAPKTGGPRLTETLHLALPVANVWAAVRDPYVIAACVPGARLLAVEGDRLRGELRASLGPIETTFAGEGRVAFEAADRRAEISGEGRDSRTGTRLSARAVMQLEELDPATTRATVEFDYALRGPLAQFVRTSLVRGVVAALATRFASNLEARLAGTNVPIERRLPAGWLIIGLVWRRLCAVLGVGQRRG